MAWGIMMAAVSMVGMLVIAVASESKESDSATTVVWEQEYYPEQIDHQLWAEAVEEPAVPSAVEGLRAVEAYPVAKPADIPLAA